ncbi:MAG: DUF177 domain-containing protein [Elusimicrobiota bacterium]
MTSLLRFDANKVREEGTVFFDGEVPSGPLQETLEVEAVLVGPLKVDLEVAERDGGADFKGSLSGVWRLDCSRCLAPAQTAFRASVEGSSVASGGAFDVTEDVRQALVLAVPMKAYCKPDCKGLCLQCKGNKNVEDCGHQAMDFNVVRRQDA